MFFIFPITYFVITKNVFIFAKNNFWKRTMIFKEKISQKQAKELFENPEKVLQFVAGVKWQNGFTCRKCGNTNFCDGKTPNSRRCTRCKKEESATSHTIFHNIKFPVNKAFFIAYNVCVLDKDLSSYCYAEKLGINQMTCWKFRKRILQCLETNSGTNGKHNIKKVLLTDAAEE